MIKRKTLRNHLHISLERSRVVALTGPRQCGKTTLAREIVKADSPNYFDLEDPVSLAMLDEPVTALQGLKGVVVIDEIQRRPDLFPVLRVLSDRLPLPARFLILGSASREGYVIEETINALEPDQAYYWATHNGAEIDLIIVKDGRMFGVECKRMDAPKITPSIKTALEDLNLEHIAVVYPGTRSFPLKDKVTAVPLKIAVKGLREIFIGTQDFHG